MAGPDHAVGSKVQLQTAANEKLKAFLDGAWQVTSFVVSFFGALEAALLAGKVTALGGAAVATMIPASFLFGLWFRSKIDERFEGESQWARASGMVILHLSIDHAIELHLQRYPSSRFKDSSNPHRKITLPSNMETTKQWTNTYAQWVQALSSELGHGQWKEERYRNSAADRKKWSDYVMSRFNRISAEFLLLLYKAEHSLGGRYTK
ncbi:hypothetical protein ABIB83_005456 [Bradyrhizobium sp. I1.8.5]|uniref:hypothetical protein n=1 Tax=Bradyrhizobium sp. I1.8.5 TaxID=3156365 RepID=UPI0033965BBC